MQKLLLWCLCVFSLWASPIEIGLNNDVSLLEHAEIFIEKNAKFEVDEYPIDASFSPYNTNFISKGYTYNEAVWLRFSLKNGSNEVVKRFLYVNNSILDMVVLYDGKGGVIKKGILFQKIIEDIFDFAFPLELQPGEERSFYLKVLANSSATYFNLYAQSSDSLWKKALNRQLILTFFFSILGTLILYNIFICLFTKERVFLMYILYLSSILYNDLSYTNMLFLILKSIMSYENVVAWSNIDTYLGPLYPIIITMLALAFVRDFMHLDRYPKIHHSLHYIFFGCVCFTIIYICWDNYIFDWIIYSMCLVVFYVLGIAVYLAYKKQENSFYFLASWGVNVAGAFLFLLYNMGIYVPSDGEYWYFYELSVVFEGIVFSIILSKRLNHTTALATSLATH